MSLKSDEKKEIKLLREKVGLPEIVAKPRKCLKCGHLFKSDGNWNRLCEDCNILNRTLEDSFSSAGAM